jgi:alpha-beta hydrolase superfamily lysophospholipase
MTRISLPLSRLIGLMAIAALLCACIPAPSPKLDPFYTPPDPLPAGQPGQIIHTEPVESAALNGAKLWRILYHSTTPTGDDIAVSGLIAQPASPAPAGGYPVLAIAHGTSGIARACAPSINVLNRSLTQTSLFEREFKPMLDAGFAIVMSDYQGMGTPGPYAYLIGASEGRNVLDSIRAIRNFGQVPVNDQTIVWGISQGGHAAAFAGEMAATYAPELTLTGVAMEAPAAELTALVNTTFAANKRGGTTGLAMYIVGAWSSAYPDATADIVLTEKGKRDLASAHTKCLFSEAIDFLFEPPSAYLKANPATVPAWAARLVENTPGQVPIRAPIFVAQGSDDPIVLLETTELFVKKMCALGNVVQFKIYPGARHLNIDTYAHADVLAWMQARLRGEPPPSNCGGA